METEKLLEAEKKVKKANKLTKISLTRWSADWLAATELYEQAAVQFKLAKQYEKAKECYDRAATGQERLQSQWNSAKHLESAGAMAKELRAWVEVADYYRRASEHYSNCGKPQPAADALRRGAAALEDGAPDDAIKMYLDSCSIMEDEGKDQLAFDTYRAATALYLKQQRYADAATMLLRWGLAADKSKSVNTQCKAYLSAIIVYLYGHDLKEAEQCYNDCTHVDAFLNSEYNRCAEQLLAAYRQGSVEEIKHVAGKHGSIRQLDHLVVKLAQGLPTGDVKTLVSLEDNGLKEDDLT